MHKKIKIAFIIDELNLGGTEKQLLKTIELLNKDKFESILICLRPSDYFYRLDIPCEKCTLDVYSLLSIHGFLKFLWFVFHLRKHRIDIVQTYFFDSTVFGVLAARIAGVKVIISCKRDLGFWYTSKLLRVLKLVNIFVHRFLVNSNAVKVHISKHEKIPSEKIDVIYNGIDVSLEYTAQSYPPSRESLGILPSDYVVGIVANLNRPVKRIDLFIKAAAIVLDEVKNVQFVIVGDGHLKEQLMKLRKILGISERVIFVGRQDKVRPYISLFDVGVLCSNSEGFSNSILEYMAAGIPVVATAVGGNKEVIEQEVTGILVAPGDYKSMAEKICTLLKDRRRRLQIGGEGTSIVQEKYAWDSKIKEIEGYYQSITGKHRKCY